VVRKERRESLEGSMARRIPAGIYGRPEEAVVRFSKGSKIERRRDGVLGRLSERVRGFGRTRMGRWE
jgi:hypothetical protein